MVDASRGERTLEDAAAAALAQIREKRYAAGLAERGIASEHILCNGVAFGGRDVLVAAG